MLLILYQRAIILKNSLNTCISAAINLGKGDLIDDLLIAYYNTGNPQSFGTNIYIIPNQENKDTFCLSSKAIFLER